MTYGIIYCILYVYCIPILYSIVYRQRLLRLCDVSNTFRMAIDPEGV